MRQLLNRVLVCIVGGLIVAYAHSQPMEKCHWCVVDTEEPVLANLTDTLSAQGIPFPEDWARVAWLETNNGAVGVGRWNNIFGMGCTDRPTVDSCAMAADGFMAVYDTRLGAVLDLKARLDLQPMRFGETFEAYIERLGWNPLPDYHQRLNRVDLDALGLRLSAP